MTVTIKLPANGNNNMTPRKAVIKVIGVGGGGNNAVDRMIAANITDVQFTVVNTDASVLRRSVAEDKIQIGIDGLGVGGDPQKGETAALESEEILKDTIMGANMVFVTTGMGGGTGTGAAPVIAKIARELGILTVGVVTKPFTLEGKKRIENANTGIEKIKEYTDALIVIPNDKIFAVVDLKTPIEEMYKRVDDVLRISIQSITDTITKTGLINIDFADVQAILGNASNAIIGLGEGETIEEAFTRAMTNVFVEGPNIKIANRMLINISSSRTNPFTVGDEKWIDDFVKKEFKQCDELKKGHIVGDVLDTKIKVSIIASFNKTPKKTTRSGRSSFSKVKKKTDRAFAGRKTGTWNFGGIRDMEDEETLRGFFFKKDFL
jgi:cell division protein FtsZ